MSRHSVRRRALIVATFVSLVSLGVSCGGDDSSSDIGRDDLEAILLAAEVDPSLIDQLSDSQLKDAVDQLLAGLEAAAPADTESVPTDSTVVETVPEVNPMETGAPMTQAPVATDVSTADDSGLPSGGIVITIAKSPLTIPIGNLTSLLSTLAITDVSSSVSGGIRTFSITVTENGLGINDIAKVRVDWVVDGVATPLQATKASDVSLTKSIWTVSFETGPARLTVTAVDKNGDEVSKSFVLNQ